MTKIKRGEDFTYLEFFTNAFNKFGKVWQVTLWIALKLLVPIIVAIVFVIVMVAGFAVSATGSSTGIIFGVIGLIGYVASLIWGVAKSFLYTLSLYIINDNPNMLAKEAVEKSAELMNGHRWSYFWLQLSFIGWAILAAITLGIGMLWLIPYVNVSKVAFYEELSGNKEVTPKEEVSTENVDPIQ